MFSYSEATTGFQNSFLILILDFYMTQKMLYINWWEALIKLSIQKLNDYFNEWEKVWINEGSKNTWIWKYVSWSPVKLHNVVIMNRSK